MVGFVSRPTHSMVSRVWSEIKKRLRAQQTRAAH